MNPRELFCLRYQQLETFLSTQSAEDMLSVSMILRQFLVDGSRLVDPVNRDARLQILFTVGMSTLEREEEMQALGLPKVAVHFLAAFPPNEPRKTINLDKFLSFQVVKFEENHFSVRSLIKTCANRLGGVHYGDPDSDKPDEEQIRILGEVLNSFGMPGAFSTLFLIGSVSLNALRPLYEFHQSDQADRRRH
jgi:hypothetical protein